MIIPFAGTEMMVEADKSVAKVEVLYEEAPAILVELSLINKCLVPVATAAHEMFAVIITLTAEARLFVNKEYDVPLFVCVRIDPTEKFKDGK